LGLQQGKDMSMICRKAITIKAFSVTVWAKTFFSGRRGYGTVISHGKKR